MVLVLLLQSHFRKLHRKMRDGISKGLTAARRIVKSCAWSPSMASLYYCVFDSAFRREQWSVIEGQRRYELLRHAPQHGFSLLRRNIHRLEKGLLMRPFRSIFATEYIVETVDCFVKTICGAPAPISDELCWARDVLHLYFSRCGSHPNIESGREAFRSVSSQCGMTTFSMVPYAREVPQGQMPTFEQLTALARYRRSVRWFQDKRVERELINKAVAVAAQSPSACNRQPFVFRIFDEPKMTARVASIPMGTAGYRHNIPVFVVIVGQQRNYFDERDRHLIYIDASLAAMAFIYAAESLGLSTCCVNWPDVDALERELAELIRLEPDERPVMCLALGYADPEGLVAYSQKKSVEQLCKYNLDGY